MLTSKKAKVELTGGRVWIFFSPAVKLIIEAKSI